MLDVISKYLSLETIFSEILYLQFHRSFFLSRLVTYVVMARFSRAIQLDRLFVLLVPDILNEVNYHVSKFSLFLV